MRPWVRAAVVLTVGALLGTSLFSLTGRSGTSTGGASLVASTTTSSSPPSTTSPHPPPPLAPPSTVPVPTTPPRGRLVVQGVGDVNLDPSYLPVFRSEGYDYAFAGLEGAFVADDLTVVNLECAPSPSGSPLDKAFTFRCDPDALPVARANGVEVASLANNHAQDFGVEAMLDGRRRLLEAGIAPVGVGEDLARATSPALFEVEGWKVAVLGMGGVVPSAGWLATEDRPGMASGDDIGQMTEAVRAAAEMADLVVVTIHWGWELETEPRADDRERAEAMVEAGADVIFGHHPHRLGALEDVGGSPVFWTLGNFVWPRLSDDGATTAIGRVVVSPSGEVEACLVPAFIERSGQPVLSGPAPCGEG